MIKLYKFHFLIICLIGYSCGENDKNSNLSDKIVLRVGQVEITEYEFDKNLIRYLKFFRSEHKQFPPDDSIKAWIETFIDDTILLAEAYSLGYHNNVEIAKDVAFMARKMLTKRYGSLYREVVTKRAKVSSELFREAKTKREIEFELTYLKFETREDMILVLGSDSVFTSREEFERAIAKSWIYPEIPAREYYFLWPDVELFEIQDEIYQLEQGETSKPLYTSDGIFIVHIYYKGASKQNISNKELIWLLEVIEKKKLELAFDHRVKDSANLVVNKILCDKIFGLLMSNHNNKIVYLDSAHVSKHLNTTLAKYAINSISKNVTTQQLIDFYNYSPLRGVITKKDDLYKILRDKVFEDYTFWLASKMKLDQEPQFKLDQKNYMNRLILRKFLIDIMNTVQKLSIDNIESDFEKQTKTFEEQGFHVSKSFEYQLSNRLQRNIAYKTSLTRKTELADSLMKKFNISGKNDLILSMLSLVGKPEYYTFYHHK